MSQVEGPGGLTELRRQAETILRERTSQSAFSSGASFPAADALRALHELSVHQIELEAQNEELQRAIAEVEAGRERYSNFYDLSPVGFCSLSDQGVFLEANHTMARMLGIPQDELVGQSFARYIINKHLDVYNQHSKLVFETSDPQAYDLEIVAVDGGVFWTHIAATIALDSKGSRVCRLVVSDITERKKAEVALKEREYFFRESQRTGNIGSYKIDFIIGNWESSEVLDTIFGIDKSYDRCVQGWLDLVHPNDQAMMDQYLKEVVLAGKKPFSKEYRIIRKRDASTRWLFGHGEVQFDEDGNVLSMIGTIQDITERKSDEESLRSSEAKLNLALVSAEMGVWTLDIRENRRHFDDRVCQLLGIDKDTFGGSQEEFLRVVVPDDHAGIRISSQKTIQENRPYEVEYRVRWEDGSIHTVCARGRLTRDEAGRPLGILGILWDITEHKQDVEALQNIAQRLLLATTSANIGVWDWDFLSGSMTWDDRMFELYGASHGEIQGTVQDWKDALHPDDLERAISECEAAIRGEAPFGTEFRVKHRDGAIHWIKANALVLRDQHGKPVRMIGLNQDITEQRKAQDEVHCLNQSLEKRVQERTAQLEVANKELEAFSYSVSHDLRSPLRSIDGFSRVLTEDYQDKLDENGKHYLSRIQLGTQRMGHLIDDLLKLSKTSRHEMTISECDLSRLCSQVVGDLADLNPERRIEVIIQPGMLVQADHRLIRVVLENLLGNAWKFTSKSEAPRIEVGEIVSSGGKRTFFIRDNGAGFDMAYADKLFNAFQRLHASSDFEGTGIGLAIVQRIIHRHGGGVWAEAKPDEGATFFFAIPD